MVPECAGEIAFVDEALDKPEHVRDSCPCSITSFWREQIRHSGYCGLRLELGKDARVRNMLLSLSSARSGTSTVVGEPISWGRLR